MKVQEYLLQSAGGEGKESLPSGGLKLGTSVGELPVWQCPMYFSELITQNRDVFQEAKTEAGFIYPINLSIGSAEARAKLGEGIKLSNEVYAPYLPYFSVIGQIERVETREDGWVYLHFSLGRKDFPVAISAPGLDENPDRTEYEVQTANYSLSEYENNEYLKKTYPKGYSYFNIQETNYFRSHTSKYTSSGKSTELKSEDLNELDGKVVVLGPDPKRDYAFCDFDFQVGPYTWPSAWYTKDGVPIAHAILVQQ